jgi:phage terminase small subunit
MCELSPKHRAFVEAYLISWNASDAARKAGYNGKSNIVGPRLLSDVSIAEEITRRVAELKMGADEALLRLADHARGSMEDLLAFEEVKTPLPDGGEETRLVCTGLDLAKAKAAGKLHLIKSVKETRHGLTVELYSAQEALGIMAKVHGLLTDNVNVTGLGDMTKWLKS